METSNAMIKFCLSLQAVRPTYNVHKYVGSIGIIFKNFPQIFNQKPLEIEDQDIDFTVKCTIDKYKSQ